MLATNMGNFSSMLPKAILACTNPLRGRQRPVTPHSRCSIVRRPVASMESLLVNVCSAPMSFKGQQGFPSTLSTTCDTSSTRLLRLTPCWTSGGKTAKPQVLYSALVHFPPQWPLPWAGGSPQAYAPSHCTASSSGRALGNTHLQMSVSIGSHHTGATVATNTTPSALAPENVRAGHPKLLWCAGLSMVDRRHVVWH